MRHSDTGHFDAFSPPAIQALSHRLIEGAHQRPGGSSKRLYVSRGNVSLRRVSNEEAVMSYLSTYGFECISLDHMPLQKQIQLFHQATHVISAHGGALTNLMYLSPGCQVLEIFQTGHGVRPDFFQLTALAGGIYSFSLADSINTKNDIELPIDVLRTFLEASL
ncbi:MAG: glycosyltransferase family 61 protein [Cyanobacteriota bacterium]|nr:glycosyltransferase family 61 protein [Cyanobacteriota bacterium]